MPKLSHFYNFTRRGFLWDERRRIRVTGFFGGMKVDRLGIGEIQSVQFGMLVPQAPTLGSDGMTAICDEEGDDGLTLCERLS